MSRRLRSNDWLFDGERDDGGIIVNRVATNMPEYTPGKSIPLELHFWAQSSSILHEVGGTAGGEHGFQAGGPHGTTAGPIGAQGTDHRDRYRQVREYTRYAGNYSRDDALDGTPLITERLPDDATVDSIIVPLRPGPALLDTPGLWVVIDDVEDESRFLRDMAKIQIEVTVLGQLSDYDSRQDLKDKLGSTLT